MTIAMFVLAVLALLFLIAWVVRWAVYNPFDDDTAMITFALASVLFANTLAVLAVVRFFMEVT